VWHGMIQNRPQAAYSSCPSAETLGLLLRPYMGYDYFVAVPKSDASGTYCDCASRMDYRPVNLRMPIHSSHSKFLMATSNKSERYLAPAVGTFGRV
jgi:hypothetical protein